ncbi:MAG: acyl-ACP--UDP-N-acetylglucosamine O-acyltransferase [Gammaproteobacteria bacterium]|nr:acyl-ACP--UDP-N-acetylglucosamine O-acyltransferase [Gammaproteobacteria bacterium]MCP5298950.1 acyl-ACP--UDP-N-acetylglucosamine O-acyltransferase [Chromatiaceae bacterium]
MIDPRAVVDPAAEVDEGVSIGPFSVIGPGVSIGSGTWVGPHVVIRGNCRIGRENRIYQFASIAEDPQDKKYANEETFLEIGDRNTIREYVTIHRGTAQDVSLTKVGNDNLLMAYTHVAHDCRLGDHVIMANAASLAGHVQIGDWAILGGFTIVHQFCRLGAHCFTAMGSAISKDVPPYVMVGGQPAQPHGINSEGLKRRDFTKEQIATIKRAYRTLYSFGLSLAEARGQIEAEAQANAEMRSFAEFLASSERSIVR